jgi:hypothetical protein
MAPFVPLTLYIALPSNCFSGGYSYFRKAEKFTPSKIHHKTTYEHHGDSGPWLTGYCESHVGAVDLLDGILRH